MADPLAPFVQQLQQVVFFRFIPLAILGSAAAVLFRFGLEKAVAAVVGFFRRKPLQEDLKEKIDPLEAPPACPKCRSVMVKRFRRGGRKNDPFWGCPQFPRCRGARSIPSPL